MRGLPGLERRYVGISELTPKCFWRTSAIVPRRRAWCSGKGWTVPGKAQPCRRHCSSRTFAVLSLYYFFQQSVGSGLLAAQRRAASGTGRVDPRVSRSMPLEHFKLRPVASRVFEDDGLSSLSNRILGRGQLSHHLQFPVTINPVHEIIRVEL